MPLELGDFNIDFLKGAQQAYHDCVELHASEEFSNKKV